VPSEAKTVAFFQLENPERCTPSKISFSSNSYVLYNQNEEIELSWQFEGGRPATSSSSNVEVEFNDFGVFDVQLIATSSVGSDTLLLEDYIKIEQPSLTSALSLPFTETFEGNSFDNLGWTDENVWEITNIGQSSSNSLFANNYDDNFNGEAGDVITPTFKLEEVLNIQIDFDLAYAPYSDTDIDDSFDSLAIYLGDGCGNKTLVWQRGGDELATSDTTESAFIPETSEWNRVSVLVNDVSDFLVGRVYFSNIGYFGNNIYVDNIQIIARNDLGLDSDLMIFPNPNDGNFSVSLTNPRDFSDMKLTIFNHLGIEVYTASGKNVNGGKVSVATLSNGIYIVRAETSNKTYTKRIVVDK
jgi:PKD repeat protein